MRFALATAGDGIDDPNFAIENVDTAVLQIYTFLEWVQEMIQHKSSMVNSKPTNFNEKLFEAEISFYCKKADHHYERLEFRDAVTAGFFDLQKARDEYRKRAGSIQQLCWPLIESFIRSVLIMLAPITSHTCEYLWRHELKEEGSIFEARFPCFGEPDLSIMEANKYIQRLISASRNTLSKKGQANSEMRIYVSTEYPPWTQLTLLTMKEYFEKFGTLEDTETQKLPLFVLQKDELKKESKKVMAFVGKCREDYKKDGLSALDLVSPFDEIKVLTENADYIAAQLSMEKIVIRKTSDADIAPEKPAQLVSGAPGKPLTFWSK